jgi:hypothetical protein
VKWNREDNDRMHLQVNIPANTRAEIVLAVTHPEWIREGRINANGTLPDDHISITHEHGSCLIETGSGKYDFYFPLDAPGA